MLKSKLNYLTLRTKLKTDKMSKNRFYQVQNYQVVYIAHTVKIHFV